MLLWAWILGVMGLVMAWRVRKSNTKETVFSLAVMAVVIGFFACVMIFAADPFVPAKETAAEGMGLNPLLQNLAMVVHPPMLFLGYAGFTVPFALMCGARLSGNRQSKWLVDARAWMVFAWLALTVGIVLGGAVGVCGTGLGRLLGVGSGGEREPAAVADRNGAPAFSASTSQRGVFKKWTVSLVVISFFLCILGTYLMPAA